MRWSKQARSRNFPRLLLTIAFAFALTGLAQTESPRPGISQTDAPPPVPVPVVPDSSKPAILTKPQAPAASPIQLRFVVVLDPGHGGEDTGAKLGAGTLEKDIVLSISTRLRVLLNAKGIPVIVTRDADTSPTADDRAAIANRAKAAACLSLHATATGTGVHLFTSSLSPANYGRDEFIPWNEAQATANTQSVRLASDVNTALGNGKLPVLLGRTALRPLNSFTCPALAVELAPLNAGSGAASLTDSSYQQRLAAALAEALVAWRVDWRQRP
jgi:N-acetylmuramoyl-L-alanine amidase